MRKLWITRLWLSGYTSSFESQHFHPTTHHSHHGGQSFLPGNLCPDVRGVQTVQERRGRQATAFRDDERLIVRRRVCLRKRHSSYPSTFAVYFISWTGTMQSQYESLHSSNGIGLMIYQDHGPHLYHLLQHTRIIHKPQGTTITRTCSHAPPKPIARKKKGYEP